MLHLIIVNKHIPKFCNSSTASSLQILFRAENLNLSKSWSNGLFISNLQTNNTRNFNKRQAENCVCFNIVIFAQLHWLGTNKQTIISYLHNLQFSSLFFAHEFILIATCVILTGIVINNADCQHRLILSWNSAERWSATRNCITMNCNLPNRNFYRNNSESLSISLSLSFDSRANTCYLSNHAGFKHAGWKLEMLIAILHDNTPATWHRIKSVNSLFSGR